MMHARPIIKMLLNLSKGFMELRSIPVGNVSRLIFRILAGHSLQGMRIKRQKRARAIEDIQTNKYHALTKMVSICLSEAK